MAFARSIGHVCPSFGMGVLHWACVPYVWHACAPTLGTCTLSLACMLSPWKPQILHGNPKFPVEEPKSSIGNPKLTLENINSPLGMCALRLTRTRSLGHVRHPFGTRALRLARTRSSWLARFPLSLRALPWACVPSDWHACTHLGLNAPHSAHACYLGHVRAAFGNPKICTRNDMCAIRLERAPSVCLAHAPSGLCALRSACTRSS